MLRDVDWSIVARNIRRGNYHPFLNRLWQAYFGRRSHEGVDVAEEDWDYLVILDACRYDVFEEENWLDGRLEKRVSKGSCTREWMKKNFQGGDHGDIVYVTGGGWIPGMDFKGVVDVEQVFHAVEPVALSDHDEQEAGTTTPEAVTAAAVNADQKYPHKRKIIHYVQPHAPYIGEPRLTYESAGLDAGDTHGMFTHPDHAEAYRGNLRRALESVETLVEQVNGRIVISADHGEAFGEKGVLEHPGGVYFPELVEVPWFVSENGERPMIRDDTQGIDI